MLTNRAQSTVEYILLVSAVIAVMVAFLVKPGGLFQARLNSTLDEVSNQMVSVANRIAPP